MYLVIDDKIYDPRNHKCMMVCSRKNFEAMKDGFANNKSQYMLFTDIPLSVTQLERDKWTQDGIELVKMAEMNNNANEKNGKDIKND